MPLQFFFHVINAPVSQSMPFMQQNPYQRPASG